MKKKKIKNIRLVLLLPLLAFTFISSKNSVGAKAQEIASATALSQMSEEECLAFVERNGVNIPDEFADSPKLGNLVKNIIRQVDKNPEHEFSYNYHITLDFAEDIKALVNNYRGISNQSVGLSSISSISSNYTFQDNTFYSFDIDWTEYNCYAYAIERDEDPSEFMTDRQYQPGDFSGDFFDLDFSIYEMTQVVKSDLEVLGFENITISNSRPAVQVDERLICMRKGDWDYHLMKLYSGSWYHKPGFTAILKYNYQPSNNRVWIGEYGWYEGEEYLGDIVYDSEIYYIKYTNSTPLKISEPVEGIINDNHPFTWFKFVAPVTGKYTFISANSVNATATLYDNSGVLLSEDQNGSPMDFLIQRDLSQGQTVYLKVKEYYYRVPGNFTVNVLSDVEEIILDRSINGNISDYKPVTWYRFVAPATGQYSFIASALIGINAYGALYDEVGNLIEDHGSPVGVELNPTLTQGQTVYLKISGYESGVTGNYSLLVSRVRTTKFVSPSHYGYQGQYFFEEMSKTVTGAAGFQFVTNRLRCGFIEGRYLTLSANRRGAGTAFLEYKLAQSIHSLHIEIGLWSATENITDQTADILFQYKNQAGDWITKHDFSIADMSKTKDYLDEHYFEFNTDVKEFRVYVTTTNTGGDSNKGRVVIGALELDIFL